MPSDAPRTDAPRSGRARLLSRRPSLQLPRPKGRVHYGVVVATLTVFLVGGPSGFLVLRSYFETREHVTTLANAIFREVSRSLVARSRSLLALAPPTLSVLAGQSPEEAAEDENEALSRRLVRVLEAGPGFDRLEFGSRNGTFLGLHHRDDGVVERTMVRLVDGQRVETVDELLPTGPHVLEPMPFTYAPFSGRSWAACARNCSS